MASSQQRQPWPMKWIVVAIIVIIVPYTYLTLRYRKAGPAFEPYDDMKNRANVARLLEAGFRRISVPAQRSPGSTASAGVAAAREAPAGLPPELRATLVEKPLLPGEISRVSAPAEARPNQPYLIHFECMLPDESRQVAGAEIFVRDERVVVVPTFAPAPGNLRERSRKSEALLTIPAGTLKSGRYEFLLVGERVSRAWTLVMR